MLFNWGDLVPLSDDVSPHFHLTLLYGFLSDSDSTLGETPLNPYIMLKIPRVIQPR